MPSFTAKLGTFDFASYLRVTPGDGLDPYSQSFVDPVWGSAPGGEGQISLGTDVHNREMSWPLYLNAASKDALHTLVINLNREIAKLSADQILRVEWKDASASNSTFYDVAYARFEPDYNFRRSEKGWAAGTLRVWCSPPYGHTATAVLMGSRAGTQYIIGTVPAGSLTGDAQALCDYSVWTPGGFRYGGPGGRIIGISALPNSSYVPFWTAASMTPLYGATYGGASGAPGSQMIYPYYPIGSTIYLQSNNYAQVGLAGAVYAGRNRVLGLFRPARLHGMYVSARDYNGQIIGPTSLVQTWNDGWCLADLGVISIPSSMPTQIVRVGMADVPRYGGGAAYEDYQFSLGPSMGNAGQLGGVYVLPEDSTAVHIDQHSRQVGGRVFGGSGVATTTSNIYDDYGNNMTLTYNVETAEGLWLNKNGLTFRGDGMWSFSAPGVNFRTRAAFNTMVVPVGGSAVFMGNQAFGPTGANRFTLGKIDSNSRGVVADLGMHGSYPYFMLTAGDATAGIAMYATAGLYLATSYGGLGNVNGTQTFIMEVWQQEDVCIANLRMTNANLGIYTGGTWGVGATVVPIACISLVASSAMQVDGNAYAQVTASVATAAIMVRSFTHEILDGRSSPSEAYVMSGINNQTLTSGSYGTADRTSALRGALPKMSPSGGKFVAFVAEVDGGGISDLITASISVRDRFIYAR